MSGEAQVRAEALQHSAQGEPYSARYGDLYASRAGAAGQAREVFLRGCGLLGEQARWRDRRQFVVLETGFGLGTNFLATWQAWRDDPRRPELLHYVALELHPLRAEDLLRECADPQWHELVRQLAERWPAAMQGLHPVWLEAGRVRLLLAFGDAADMLARLDLGADAVYLDGFAPSRNPRMWSPELLAQVAALCRPGARAASYTVAGAVREGLQAAGFETRKEPGYGGKAQRLEAALRQPASTRARAPGPAPGTAMVIGAGLAGAAAARALARRGWRVRVLDAQGVAAGASGLPAGLAHLRPAAADEGLARLTRAGLAWLRQTLEQQPAQLQAGDGVWMSAGHARLGKLAGHAADWPPQCLRAAEAEACAAAAGLPEAPAAWWTAGGAVAAGALCAAWLGQPGIELRVPCAVHALGFDAASGEWLALDAQGQELERARVCVLACAGDGERLLRASGLLEASRKPLLRTQSGQGFVVAEDDLQTLRGLRCGVMGSAYALPLPPAAVAARGLDPAQRWLFVGATHEHAGQPAWSAQQAWQHVGAGLQEWCAAPGWPRALPASALGFRGERTGGADRLPLAGRWAGAGAPPGLYLSLGMGSRGLLLSTLAAEIIAGELEGEPAPLERDLMDALAPGRFSARRGET
ncbi:MAG: tRNA (5-methylaminomethyl-2-thiouridine)(34)-methyltransferase MnmD [Betaproteobacteria bacterium]|nr:tRNA (5-methylaminomethyl-2-thiouridine)(34)-methyltransferase MnmD [Betaproteobacteria bacterium]MDE1955774.1 tRNA (5-methylaminomethyl-2-thiouridine)(34)-methyltransferase MnmD [Betaproteobacteria bacterium]